SSFFNYPLVIMVDFFPSISSPSLFTLFPYTMLFRSLDDMHRMQELYQSLWADNAVSYTANVDPGKYTVSDLMDTLIRFGGKLKGATIFPEMSRPQAPYERITKEEFEQFEATQTADGVDEECASGACPVK